MWKSLFSLTDMTGFFVFWVRLWPATLSSPPKPLRQLHYGELRMKRRATRVHTGKAAVWFMPGWKSLNLCSSVPLNLLLWPNRRVRKLWKSLQNLYISQLRSSMIFQTDLEHALNCLQREDPSLKVKTDPDSGQVIIKQLHLQYSFRSYFCIFNNYLSR